MATLDVELDLLAASAAGALVSAGTFAKLARAVRGLPSSLTRQFGFECPLGVSEGVADFYLRVAHREERASLASCALPEHLQRHPLWQRLQRFGRSWLDPGGSLSGLKEIWLELDVCATRVRDSATPGLFVLIERDADAARPGAYAPDPERALAQAAGPLPAAVLRSVRRCLAAVPPYPNVSFFLGALPGRETDAVRVCIRNLPIAALRPCLEAVDWPGPIDTACANLAPFAHRADRLTLDLDAADGIGPRIGLECGFTPVGGSIAADALGEALVRGGLCAEHKRGELVSWTGRTFEVASGLAPPDDVSDGLALAGLQASPALVGRLNHVKISLREGHLDAKVYLSLDRRWRVQPL